MRPHHLALIAFTNDQLIAGLQIALDNFRVGAVIVTELDRDCGGLVN